MTSPIPLLSIVKEIHMLGNRNPRRKKTLYSSNAEFHADCSRYPVPSLHHSSIRNNTKYWIEPFVFIRQFFSRSHRHRRTRGSRETEKWTRREMIAIARRNRVVGIKKRKKKGIIFFASIAYTLDTYDRFGISECIRRLEKRLLAERNANKESIDINGSLLFRIFTFDVLMICLSNHQFRNHS